MEKRAHCLAGSVATMPFEKTACLCQLRFVPLKINLPLTEAVACFPVLSL